MHAHGRDAIGASPAARRCLWVTGWGCRRLTRSSAAPAAREGWGCGAAAAPGCWRAQKRAAVRQAPPAPPAGAWEAARARRLAQAWVGVRHVRTWHGSPHRRRPDRCAKLWSRCMLGAQQQLDSARGAAAAPGPRAPHLDHALEFAQQIRPLLQQLLQADAAQAAGRRRIRAGREG